MTAESPREISDREELIELIQGWIDRAQAGEQIKLALRLRLTDGTTEDLTLGFENEEEEAAALAKLYRLLGELH